MISPSDKIIRFADLEGLKSAIEQDLSTRDVNAQRYCVRFIMLNDFATFRDLTSFLCKEIKVEMFELQNLMLGEDKTITIDKLSNAIKRISQSSLVTPFSELVRFYKESDFNGFFNEIILNEDLKHPNKRIYIPIIGLNNRFNDFLKNFGRIEESAPIWQLYSPKDDKVSVYVTKFKLPKLPESSEYCVLEKMKDWMDFWRKQAPRDKILCSAFPIRIGWKNSRPDSIFSFTEISNPYEYISDFLGVSLPFEYVESEIEYWQKILDEISDSYEKGFSWKRYVEYHFNTIRFTFNKILEIWSEEKTTDYERWLLRNYLLHSKILDEKPYIRICVSETTDYHIPAALFAKISERIFYSMTESEIESNYKERAQTMKQEKRLFHSEVPQSSQDWIMGQIIERAKQNEGFGLVKKLMTGTFNFEKELFFGWYQKRPDKEFGMNHLKEFYPDLHAYLKDTPEISYRPGNEWVADYFNAYREAKVKDVYTDAIKSFIKIKNANDQEFWDWYYKHPSCHELFHEYDNNDSRRPDKVYWIDGLGAEFIPFILHLIKESKTNYEVIDAQVTTTGLPSNTMLNRFDVDNKTIIKMSELDNFAHSGHYQTRKTLISELSIIRNQITKILRDNSVGNHTIAIVSDHGLSALSRLCEPHRLTGKSHHEGRYIPYTSDIAAEPMPEYVTVRNSEDNKDYKVALTHSSLGNKPSHEVHGGCTPEEILVPFIVLTNIDGSKPIEYDVKVKTTELPKSAPIFECLISPQPKSVVMIANGSKIPMEANNITWKALIPNVKEGKTTVSIIPERGKSHNFDMHIYGFSMGKSLIDDDF